MFTARRLQAVLLALCAVVPVTFLLTGCALLEGNAATGKSQTQPGWKVVTPGVRAAKIQITRPDNNRAMPIQVYLPENAPSAKGLPCVLVPPAGTRLFHGASLDADVSANVEHVPYALAGFAVVTFPLDGPLEMEEPNDPQLIAAGRAFVAAKGGILNAKAAVGYALKDLHVDPKRLYIAGHSSAATLALQVAENDPRIKACIAYAPAVNLESHFNKTGALNVLEQAIPGFIHYAQTYSPHRKMAALKCPLFFFQAADDSVIDTEQNRNFVRTIRKTNKKVSYIEEESGDHFDAMVQNGIPKAIAWLKKLEQTTPKK
jgi:dienelactone hydrolase